MNKVPIKHILVLGKNGKIIFFLCLFIITNVSDCVGTCPRRRWLGGLEAHRSLGFG